MFMSLMLAAAAWSGPWEDVAAAAEMTPEEVQHLCAGVEKQQSILDRMAKPWEARPWFQYWPIFLTDERTELGVAFWDKHQQALADVQKQTGVPAEIIVAIIGVETKFGTIMGDDPVVEALYTLGFFHPRRGLFFRKELGHYLRLAVDEEWDLKGRQGSYAGAMGMGQFIPSSYRNYAVDGDGDGKRDLFGNPNDAIASVANYFKVHGWHAKGRTLISVQGDAAVLDAAVSKGLKLDTTWAQLQEKGITTRNAPPGDAKVRVFRFQTADGPEYRVGLNNFYVITRYNHSQLYARVVDQLSRDIVKKRNQ